MLAKVAAPELITKIIVTGPSLTSSTFIIAPNTPSLTWCIVSDRNNLGAERVGGKVWAAVAGRVRASDLGL